MQKNELQEKIERLEDLYVDREEKLEAVVSPLGELYEIELQIGNLENAILKSLSRGSMLEKRTALHRRSSKIPKSRSDFVFRPKTRDEKLAVTVAKVLSKGIVYPKGFHLGDMRKIEFEYD